MPISFGRKSKVKTDRETPYIPLHPDCSLVTQAHSRLIDVRSPEAFRKGFIPGSYNVPDLACLSAAQSIGFLQDREIYLLADDVEQLYLFPQSMDARDGGAEKAFHWQVMGWFGPDAIDEWYKMNTQVGSFEAIDFGTLAVRVASLETIILDIFGQGEKRTASQRSALCFGIDELPRSLDGLPEETSICVTASSTGLASFAASLLWNFGYRRLMCLNWAAAG